MILLAVIALCALLVFAVGIFIVSAQNDAWDVVLADNHKKNMDKRERFLRDHKPIFGDGRTYWDYIYGGDVKND